MPIDTQPTADRIAANRDGRWADRTLLDHLDAAALAAPDKVAFFGRKSGFGTETALSYRQLDRLSRRVAVGLAALGVGKGDVVSMILPNWCEFPLVHLACLRLGAVTNPLMPILRHRELSFMLALAESKALIIPKSFRDFDYPAMIADLRPALPALRHVLVVEGSGDESFGKRLIERRWEDDAGAAALFAANRPSPNDPIELLYTSGTTGEPKGVLHTSNTLLSSLPPLKARLRLGADDVVLMGSPLAHQTGFVYGMALAILLGAKCVLQDIWDPKTAARLIADEGVTYSMASTPFLADLTRVGRAGGGAQFKTLRTFIAAGAPIPSVLVTEAGAVLGATIASGWGMTENGLVTVTRADDADERASGTDGVALEHMEVRVVDAENRLVPPDVEGRLQTRGAGNFVGYLKRPDAYGVDADGWFETGDIARVDATAYIRICGRAKDIIIRGGENIPVVEVEQLLYRHPAVAEVAVVAMPDERLGERACAYVALRPGQSLAFEEMVAFLIETRIARQYVPERLEIVSEMPRTASGKIQKFALREAARHLAPMSTARSARP